MPWKMVAFVPLCKSMVVAAIRIKSISGVQSKKKAPNDFFFNIYLAVKPAAEFTAVFLCPIKSIFVRMPGVICQYL